MSHGHLSQFWTSQKKLLQKMFRKPSQVALFWLNSRKSAEAPAPWGKKNVISIWFLPMLLKISFFVSRRRQKSIFRALVAPWVPKRPKSAEKGKLFGALFEASNSRRHGFCWSPGALWLPGCSQRASGPHFGCFWVSFWLPGRLLLSFRAPMWGYFLSFFIRFGFPSQCS